MNILMKLAPHAAILIGNMYYVFWGIDRVNRSMNFIDNPYTKFLLVILIACSGLNDVRLTYIHLDRLRRTDDPAPVYFRLGVVALNALLAAVILILLVIDLFGEDLLLFLNEFVKAMILLLSLTSLLNSLQLTARERARIRMENRRRAQMRRRPMQREPMTRREPMYQRESMPQRRPMPQRSSAYQREPMRPREPVYQRRSASYSHSPRSRSNSSYHSNRFE